MKVKGQVKWSRLSLIILRTDIQISARWESCLFFWPLPTLSWSHCKWELPGYILLFNLTPLFPSLSGATLMFRAKEVLPVKKKGTGDLVRSGYINTLTVSLTLLFCVLQYFGMIWRLREGYIRWAHKLIFFQNGHIPPSISSQAFHFCETRSHMLRDVPCCSETILR